MITLARNEEKLKTSTDCIYFLASPFTCKKGNDCEFRHSEPARLNPRDCWFWLAGKCTKSNCTYRHLPLDGISETKPIVKKHSTPCFYFGQGYCAKGENCIFTHGLPVVKSTPFASATAMPPNLSKLANRGMECTEKCSERIGSELPVKLKEEEQITQTDCKALKDDAKISSSKTCLSAELQEDKVTDVSSRMPATPTRGGGHENVSGNNKSKLHTTLSDGSPNQMYPDVEDISVRLPSQEVLQRVHSSENRVSDCNESEDLRERNSFDILVDDARTDQVAFVNHTNYLPSSGDAEMDPIRGSTVKGLSQRQDLVNYDYSLYNEQDLSYKFEARNMYDPSEQHPCYDRMSTFDHLGIQTSCTFRGNVATMNEQKMTQVGKETLKSEDLRHYITKRRREERSPNLEEYYTAFLRSGLQPHQRRQYGAPSIYQEGWIRGCYDSGGQHYGWRECPRSRKISSYCCPEFKDHVASESGREKRETVFNKRLRHDIHEYIHGNGKMHHWPDAEAMDPALYTGCKDFAEPKAEIVKGLRQHGYFIQRIDHQEPYLPQKCRVSQPFERSEFPIVPEFEGPKPLSVLLEEKHRRIASAWRIESEEGLRSITSPGCGTRKNCESFKIAELEGPKPFLNEKHSGLADCEVKGACDSSRIENEVGFVTLSGEFQSSEKNAIPAKKDAAIVINRNSDLPTVLSTSNENGLTASKPISHCLMKKKGTGHHPVDTELTLSLSCAREDNNSFNIVDDCP